MIGTEAFAGALARVLNGWSFDPMVIASIAVVGAGYVAGRRRLRRPGRRAARIEITRAWRTVCFAAGLATVVAALLSPLDARSAELLSAHMVQHLLLVVVAAPLLVLGAPAVPLLLALPTGTRRDLHALGAKPFVATITRTFRRPVVAWALHVVTLWTWHVPNFYEAAVRTDALHALEHASFLGTALLFWLVVLGPNRHRRLGGGAEILYVFTAGLQSAILGALFTFAASPLYPTYVRLAGGASAALRDQQIAGLVMWIPAGVVYLGAAAGLFVKWLGSVEEETRRRELRHDLPPSRVRVGVEP
jgi:cytochrome c oxidase assembly factor CtaG